MQSLQAVEGIPAAMPPSWVMNRMYLDALVQAGAAPVMLPLQTGSAEVLRDTYERLDGVLLPGGVDIHPSSYGQAVRAGLRRTDPERDAVELTLARWALADDKPVLGLCRGLQVINVARGGTLFQDVATERLGTGRHDFEPPEFERSFLAHHVDIEPGSRLRDLAGEPARLVNSMHHQGVDRLGEGLTISALAPDGVAEAVEAPGRFVLGVQWHPESLVPVDPLARALFAEFVAAAA
jgi:putative glutamine amidotransferase